MFLVGVGGALGAASRYLAGIWIGKKTRNTFPHPTLYINISGSFLLGVLTGMKLTNIIPEWSWLLFGVGFCGAFTTFSTFGYEVIQLLLTKQTNKAFLYMALSIVICTISAFIGIQILV